MPRIAQVKSPGQIELVERKPLKAGPGEAVIQVQHAGIYGTDLALFHGDYPVPLPHICGHQLWDKSQKRGKE